MSFIYAKRFKDTVAIFSDTKITKKDCLYYNAEKVKFIRDYGILKSYIINPFCAIAFAGSVEIANRLLSLLKPEMIIEEIKKISYDIHINTNQEIDLVIAYYENSKCYLSSIKSGQILNVESEWLGSNQAFNEFQKRGAKNYPLDDIEIEIEKLDWFASTESINSYEKMFSRFHNTIFTSGDDSVGIFAIPLIFNNKTKQFEFRSYIKNQQFLVYEGIAIKGADIQAMAKRLICQDKRKGDYTIYFYGSGNNELMMFIAEESLSICYKQEKLNADEEIATFANLSTPIVSHKDIRELEHQAGFVVKSITLKFN